MTDEQIAHNIGINTATLYDWKKDNRPIFITKDKHGKPVNKIDEALKKGKDVVDYAVQGALLKKALSGDTMAIMYWLNNRQPDKCRLYFLFCFLRCFADVHIHIGAPAPFVWLPIV